MIKQDIIIYSDLSEAVVNVEEKRIDNVAILGRFSKNAKGEIRREYSPNALNQAVKIFEGAPAFIDHKRGQKRSLREQYGVYKDLRVDKDTVRGTLDLFECPEADFVLSVAKKSPGSAGNSITASGKLNNRGEYPVVEEIYSRTKDGFRSSIDLVDDPATTESIYEDKEEDEVMDWEKVTKEELKKNCPDLFEEIEQGGKDSRKDEVESLTEERDNLKVKVDEYTVKEQLAQKREKIDQLIEDSKLPKDVVTETFVNNLMSIEESEDSPLEKQAKALIEDRKTLIAGVKGNHEKDANESGEEDNSDELVEAIKS